MEISPSAAAADQADEVRQALLLKKANKTQEVEQLALIESARQTGPAQPLDGRLVGRLLDEKA